MQTKKILQNAAVILLITFALLIASEVILRVIYPEKTRITRIRGKPKQKDLAYEFNEDYLVSLKPGIEKKYVKTKLNGSDVIYWKTNKDSFRGNELKENPGYRIIVYGDSNVQARFSALENTYVYKLGSYLQESGFKDVETVNGGVVGFGSDQSLIRFAKEADIYHPDLVIFLISDNDFGDIIKNRLFELDQDGNFIETDHMKKIDPLLTDKKGFTEFVSSLVILKAARAVRKFATGEKTEETKVKKDPAESEMQRYFAAIEQEYSVYKQSKPKSFSHFGDHYDLDIALDPEAESSKTKIKLMDAILKRAKKFANSKGIQFLVVIQPSVKDLTRNFVFSYEHMQKYNGYRKTNLTDAVENICVSNNIAFINLFNVFSENKPEQLFFKGRNDHWNDLGQDIAAKETTLYIINRFMPKHS